MKHTRRYFIKLGGLAIGILPVLSRVEGFGRPNPAPDAIGSQNADSFRRLIGSEFTFYEKDSAVAATLTEVKTYAPAGRKTDGECFSLVFEMPADDFGQATYEMFHPEIGAFELFSVPGRSGKNNSLLIAVINRI